MSASTRKFLVAMATVAVALVPLSACSSAEDSTSNPSVELPLLQVPDANGQYSAEQQQEWLDVTGNDPNAQNNNGTPESIISAATLKDFEVPGDIAPGTYVFKPYAEGGVFYMSAGFQKTPEVQYINERTLVTIPEGSLVMERIQVYEVTPEYSDLPQIDLSNQ